MSTTIPPPTIAAKQLLGEDPPGFANNGRHVNAVVVPPLQEEPLLTPPAKETTPGRALRPTEVLSSDLPLVLVRGGEHGKELVLPGYYACVGTMPCADTEYYLLVRWEHREDGRQGERRVVLQEHIRVLDPEGDPQLVSGMSASASRPSTGGPGDLVHLTLESPASHKATGQGTIERYPQLRHSSKRKL